MKQKSYPSLIISQKHISSILLILLSTVITILCIELFIFFILDIKPPGYKPQRFFQSSLLTGHFHKPNSKGYWYRYNDGSKYQVSVNRFGFADSERNLKKTRPRITLLGDSTTEFWEVEERYRGQYIIEDLLDKQFEVLNFGVRGYGTDQTYILFKNVGIHFNPDIVIYTFCINDIINNSTSESKPHFIVNPDFPDRLLLQGYPVEVKPPSSNAEYFSVRGVSAFLSKYSFLFRNSKSLLGNMSGHKISIEKHFELRPYLKSYNENDTKRMHITLKNISMLNNFVKENGMKFLLIEGLYRPALPGKMQDKVTEQYGEIFDFNKVSKILENFSAKQGIAFLSLPKIVKEQKVPAPGLMYKEDTMHLNRDGISLYAVSVVNKLHSLGWQAEVKKGLPK